MFSFYKFNIISEERFKTTFNPSQYTIRFKELAKKSFYLENNRLYFIKDNKTERLENGNFKDIDMRIFWWDKVKIKDLKRY